MATQFRNWKKTLWSKYKNEDPDFSGTSRTCATLVKIQDNWAAFKAYKKSAQSEKTRKMLRRKYTTIGWGQVATGAPFLIG